MARRKARQQAMQLLFQWDLRRAESPANSAEDAMRGYYESLLVDEDTVISPRKDAFAEKLFRGVVEDAADIDPIIQRHAAHWRIERMSAVDRNILRIAVYEMKQTDTPAPVIIDEALELARKFSGEESVHFVNGVLDAVKRELSHSAAAQVAPSPD